MIHFDTNYLVMAVRQGTRQAVRYDGWLAAGEGFAVSAMAWAEFLCGPLTPGDVNAAAEFAGPPVPVTAADAALAATLFNMAGRRRGSLADCLIAAVAIGAGAALATDNGADFAAFAPAGLRTVA